MRGIGSGRLLRGGAVICVLAGLAAPMSAQAQAQGEAVPGSSSGQTVQALLVSDIHFEPFWDPAKVARLARTPVSQWDAILAEADSADREARFNRHAIGESRLGGRKLLQQIVLRKRMG